jgi:hypothetical protein
MSAGPRADTPRGPCRPEASSAHEPLMRSCRWRTLRSMRRTWFGWFGLVFGVSLLGCSSILGDFDVVDGGPADATGGKDATKDVAKDTQSPRDGSSDVGHADAAGDGPAVDSGPTYTIGGSVTGESSGLVLQDNGGDNLAVSGTSFTFPTPLPSGATYAVTVAKQPGQSCAVSNGTGTVASADVTDVSVTCTAQHLYVGNDNSAGGISRYGLPLTATTPVDFTFSSPNVTSITFDANGNVMAADNAGNISFFMAPLSASSTAAFTFKNGTAGNGQIAFLNGGLSLFTATQGPAVNEFVAPYSSSTALATSFTKGWTASLGIGFDAKSNLYVSNVAGSSGSNLYVLAPPYTATPEVTPILTGALYRGIALSETQLFVASVTAAGHVDVYALPITATSAPLFAISQGVSSPESLALDPDGNLYVGNLGSNSVTVYAPPFSAASAPTTTLLVSTGTFAIFGVAIAP